MDHEGEGKDEINWQRVAYSIPYLFFALLVLLCRRSELFYLTPQPNAYNVDRFLWCVVDTLFGFFFVAVHHWKRASSPFPRYLLYYPVVVLLISALVFSGCHLFEKSSGFVFYYLSFVACFVLGFLIDRFWEFCELLIKEKAAS